MKNENQICGGKKTTQNQTGFTEFVVHAPSRLRYECCTAVEDGDMMSVFIYIGSGDNNKVMVMG